MAPNPRVLTGEVSPSDPTVAHDAAGLRAIVSEILAQAQRRGATSAEAGVSVENGFAVNVRLGEVETIEHNRDKGLGVTVYLGQRKGSASTTDFSTKAIAQTVQAACDIARYTEADPYAGLVEAEFLAREIPDLDLLHPWTISTEAAITLACESEQAARDTDARISNSEGAYVSTHSSLRVYGTSHGFLGDFASSHHSLGCTVIAQHETEMQRDYWYSVARVPRQLEDPRSVGRTAAQRAVQRLQARQLKTQQSAVLFTAEVARGLLGHLVRAISGSALYRNASFLLDTRGQRLFPAFVNVDERPHLKQALGSAPFDSEGVATRAQPIIEQGTLCNYILDSYAARRLNSHTTGNAGGVHNLFVSDSNLDLKGLLQQMQRGILVTEVMGQGVNIVTGDYSRGATGFWVENGEIQYPIAEFTLAGNLRQMFSQVRAIGNDLDRRGNICTGSWLIDSMTIAGA
ncbi:MAG: metalloprotease PmbA [Gammaproteobacteria bacterium]|nr:metalloprotease PmbA [Gammaproteobacteria bacterium]